MSTPFTKRLGAAAIAATLATGAFAIGSAEAGKPQGANKAASSGSQEVFMSAVDGNTVVLLEESVKTNNGGDLLLQVSLECAITTELVTVGNEMSEARGSMRVWIEIDGVATKISSDDPDGVVTFCDRTYGRDVQNLDDQDATFRTYINTKSAHAFNWTRLDLPAGTHDIKVWATLDHATQGGDATATAMVGKRTLVIEPIKVAHGETIDIG